MTNKIPQSAAASREPLPALSDGAGATHEAGGIATAREYNAATYFIDRHAREGRGAKIAYIDDCGSYTYADLAARVNRAGHALRRLGLEMEQRVMLCVQDGIDFAALFWGAVKIGAVPVPVNTMLAADDYDYLLRDSRAKLLAVSAPLADRIAPALGSQPFLREVIVCGGAAATIADRTAHSFDALSAAAADELNAAPTVADDVALWLYSSGSTGRPKGVLHLHRSLVQTAVLYAERVLGIAADDLLFSASKMFFAYGLGNSMTFPLHAGATAVLMAERPAPAAVIRMIRTHRPTIFCGVPTLYAGMLAEPSLADAAATSRLRVCTSAGEALPAAVAREWSARTGTEILDGLGSTEALHIFVSNRAGAVRHGSSGTAVGGYELALRGEDGAATAPDAIGDLWVRGPSIGAAYWNNRAASSATFVGGWLRTGDKYLRDADGYYHFAGRSDDMLKVGGIWVSPFEVENALMAHPAVREAAVIGAAGADELIKPKAFVVLKDAALASPALAEELQDFVKARVAPYKYPRWIEFRAELPRTATGKLKRYALSQG
ncbi:MAG: benzoate-CoA ligase family protein [Candidatus Binataceae bacterium]|nr:benzoate-CoA ligase family protein [Candidatus Binataceae bacterium]